MLAEIPFFRNAYELTLFFLQQYKLYYHVLYSTPLNQDLLSKYFDVSNRCVHQSVRTKHSSSTLHLKIIHVRTWDVVGR